MSNTGKHQNILNYRIIIEKEYYEDGSPVYSAYCPTLQVYDYGDTIDATLESMKDGIDLAIECLIEENEEVPTDRIEESFVTSTTIPVPAKARVALC